MLRAISIRAIAEAYKKNPAHRVRVLGDKLQCPMQQAQVLPFSELAGQFVGLTPEELICGSRAGVHRPQRQHCVRARPRESKIEIGIDTSVIWQLVADGENSILQRCFG
jgi:hypothetical protein